jgi:hypothetical protein
MVAAALTDPSKDGEREDREEVTGLKFMNKVRISPFLSTNGIHI